MPHTPRMLLTLLTVAVLVLTLALTMAVVAPTSVQPAPTVSGPAEADGGPPPKAEDANPESLQARGCWWLSCWRR